ncbi:P-loop containing nucleoside triphosphate hydrolase protein [Coemansia spiralis]|nr:P-loop containing nucleoside triphosphate hydrolase protein [Coemansia spiralis]
MTKRKGNIAKARQMQDQSNKRRKANIPGASVAKDNEKAWAKLTMNPPPMPKSEIPGQLGNAAAKIADNDTTELSMTKRSKRKTVKEHSKNLTQDSDGDDSIAWNWKKVAVPTYIAGPDDELGGMVGLEEIEGVDCVWEEDETTGGRILKFCKAQKEDSAKQKQKGKAARKQFHSASPADDVSDAKDDQGDDDAFYSTINWDDFVLIDDYSDKKAEKGELISIGDRIRESNLDDADNSSDGITLAQNSEADLALSQNRMDVDSDDDNIEDPKVDVSSWKNFGLHPTLLRALKHLGFSNPTEIQSKTLPESLAGRDVIGAAETGSGKTLAFGIPILQQIAHHRTKWEGPTGLILAPTRELALQVRDHLIAMAKFVRARVIAIVGGMSQAKQERLLGNQPDIIIATPGRYWELVSTNDVYLKQLRAIKFLAVDEADRMLEPGHFKELKFIFKAVNEASQLNSSTGKRQTFVFSATLLKDLQLVARRKPSQKKQKKNLYKPEPGSMEDLIERVNFYDKDPVFVDVTSVDATAKSLVETRIDCLSNEKDYYLYYFLIRYPARTLIFVNSIDSIRRMLPMLRLLKVNVFGLHAQMEQRQRLKNIDRFRDTENAVLVASDVAARGLDIPQVEYVIHYQIPRSGDLYVHRSGRTARAKRKLYYKMCAKLEKDIPLFPVDLDIVGRLKPRVELAREIDLREHKMNKLAHERNWFKKNAEELDIELDSDFLPSSDDERSSGVAHSEKMEKQQTKALKGRLDQLLSKKILGRGVSGRYLSSSIISDLAERLTDPSNTNPTIPVLRKESALDTAKGKAAANNRK